MKLKLILTDIDYNSFLNFLGEAGKKLSTLNFLGRLGNQNGLIVKGINLGSNLIVKKITEICKENGIVAQFGTLTAQLTEEMGIALCLEVLDVDLGTVATKILPYLSAAVEKDPQYAFFGTLMKKHSKDMVLCFEQFFQSLSCNEQDKLIVDTVNTFSKTLAGKIEAAALKKGLILKVASVHATV